MTQKYPNIFIYSITIANNNPVPRNLTQVGYISFAQRAYIAKPKLLNILTRLEIAITKISVMIDIDTFRTKITVSFSGVG